jgi:tetratricopeptide (TPR) repeat protein
MKFFVFLACVGASFLNAIPVAAQSPALAEKAQHAKELMAAGRAGEAVPIYTELVKAVPNNPGLILNLGLALDLSGKKREAIRQYDTALKLDPNSFPPLLLTGTAYMDLGEPSKALVPLQKAVELEPGNFEAETTLAEAELGVEHFAEAAQRFLDLSAREPANAKLCSGLGSSFEGLAQKNFDALAELAPGSGYWLDLVAESRQEAMQTYSAFYLYRQALEKMPMLRGAHAAIAEIYQQTGHSDWAAAEQAKEAKLTPPDCTVDKLECAFRAGGFVAIVVDGAKSEEALYWKTRACNHLALDAYSHLAQLPPSVESYEFRARVDSKRRQYAEAAKELREALKLSPGNPLLQRELAIALYRSGSLEDAQVLLQDLLQHDRDSAALNYFLGDTLLNAQKPREALVYLQKAITREAQFLPAQKSLGLAYLQLGQADKAIPHLRLALPADQDGALHYQLGRAYQSHGDSELAQEMFKQYQEAQKKNQEENQTVEKEVSITPP